MPLSPMEEKKEIENLLRLAGKFRFEKGQPAQGRILYTAAKQISYTNVQQRLFLYGVPGKDLTKQTPSFTHMSMPAPQVKVIKPSSYTKVKKSLTHPPLDLKKTNSCSTSVFVSQPQYGCTRAFNKMTNFVHHLGMRSGIIPYALELERQTGLVTNLALLPTRMKDVAESTQNKVKNCFSLFFKSKSAKQREKRTQELQRLILKNRQATRL